MEKPQTREELQSALDGDRYRMIELLAKHGELSSGQLRDYAELPDGSKHYQLSILRSWELIKPVDARYVGKYQTGIPATVYALTEKGQTLVDDR